MVFGKKNGWAYLRMPMDLFDVSLTLVNKYQLRRNIRNLRHKMSGESLCRVDSLIQM
jgi:transcriptional regulator of met regulon